MIETTITKIQYDADGVQRRWSIPFPYADVKHISIYTKVGEEPTVKVVDNYDIDKDDSVVIYPTVASGQEPLASGTKITIARETPETQLEDASQVHFTSKDVERGLDKLTMITQELSITDGEIMEVSASAFEAAEEAVDSAALANKTAEEAKTIAGQAVGIATDAKSIAEGIDAKATQALENSNTAVNTANSAKQTAEGIDGKATQALANSATALEKATQAKNTADSYQGQITTLRNDVDDLGDQVAAIEGKIPAEATTTNPLADKEFVTTITDELAADITALDADKQDKLTAGTNITIKDNVISAVTGGDNGIKGDYCTTYGIIDAPNGILTNPSGMEVVLKQGVVLQLAGQDIKTTISGDMAHTITSTADCDLFYVSGTTSLMEVAEIVWSRIEPDNGQTGVLAWWNPDNKKWKFKSNDTGNVWAEAIATPIAHIHTNGTTITRIDHIGYRVLDDEIYALKSDLSLSRRQLGEVYFSQSSLATDNPSALPGWTGDYYENGKTLFPDLYNFVKAHSELQVTKAQYDSAIATYGECPKYVVDENASGGTGTAYKIRWAEPSVATSIIKSQTPQVGDIVYECAAFTEEPYDLSTATQYTIEAVSYSSSGSLSSITINSASMSVRTLTSVSVTGLPTVAGTSLRLPKYANYIKMANSAEGITQKGAGLPNITGYLASIDTNGRWGLIANASADSYNTNSGAFIAQNNGAYTQSVSTGKQVASGDLYFDASRSNPIYGVSATVQPVHTTLYPWIFAYTSAIPASVAQAAEFTGALTGKANTDLSNVLANIDYVVDSKVPTASDPNWYRKYKSGWVEQGGELIPSTSQVLVHTYLKPFVEKYVITTGIITTDNYVKSVQLVSITETSFSYKMATDGGALVANTFFWIAKGQGAN